MPAAAPATSVAPTPSASAPKKTPQPPPPPPETSLVDDLLENPIVPAAAGGLLALLLGFGFWRARQRKKSTQVDSSFLESRLQPDSFFGASGGQRIDTAEGNATGSSMVYSPSQLDAAGTVNVGATVRNGQPGWQSDGSFLTPEGERLTDEVSRAAYLRSEAAALEITLSGPTLRFNAEAVIAVTGAATQALILAAREVQHHSKPLQKPDAEQPVRQQIGPRRREDLHGHVLDCPSGEADRARDDLTIAGDATEGDALGPARLAFRRQESGLLRRIRAQR